MKLLIKIPTRERGFHWLKTYLDNITNPDTRIVLTLDKDDKQEFPDELYNLTPPIEAYFYHSKSKIHAINRDIEKLEDWDILMIGSDDMIPQVKGFDQIIIDHMKETFPDTDGCLWYHTEDHERELRGRNRGRYIVPGSEEFMNKWVCMLPILGKKYYERFEYVYHPSYRSFCCDDEYTEIAVKLGKIKYFHQKIVKHYHPAWEIDETYGKADNLYARNNPNWNYDHANLHNRRLKGFPK